MEACIKIDVKKDERNISVNYLRLSVQVDNLIDETSLVAHISNSINEYVVEKDIRDEKLNGVRIIC